MVMEMVVVFSPCASSLRFEKKIITLHEGESVPLRRAWKKGEHATKNNGLFDYPKLIQQCTLSRNHAEIICINSKICLKAYNQNTFINHNRIEVGDDGAVLENNDVICLGGETENKYNSVIAVVALFSSANEQYDHFCRLERDYPFFCTLPESPPSHAIKTEDMFIAARNRLEILKHLARFNQDELNSPEVIKEIIESVKTSQYVEMLRQELFYSDNKTRYKFMKDDHVAQFVLAIGFSSNRHLQYWFINQEKKLFTLRWFKMTPQEQIEFLEKYNLNYEELTHSEFIEISSIHKEYFVESMRYYKIHFSEAPIFVKKRKVFVHRGYCILRIEDMYGPLIEYLGKIYSKNLRIYNNRLSKIWWDERIRSIILHIRKSITNKHWHKSTDGSVTGRNIHLLCEESFPLCMKLLQFHLSKDHHLRNGGRYQYTLFLKGIGLNLLDATNFWKTHFTKKIDEQTFMKKYSYHIRHAYGTEGKLADYKPLSCSDILREVPGPLEYHGCPFKVLDSIRMKEALRRSRIDKKDHDDILKKIKMGDPKEACRIYFELTHAEKYPHSSVVHPNVYYDESRKIHKQREKMKIKCDAPINQNMTRNDTKVESNCCVSVPTW